MQTLLRLPRVIEMTGLPKSSVYAAVKKGSFPPPVKIGERASAWQSDAVQRWIAQRVAGTTQ